MNCKILVLYELSRLMKSKEDKVTVSSSELGDSLGVSQQTASRYLKELGDEGLIKKVKTKGGQEIRLTPEGLDTLRSMYLNLKGLIEAIKTIEGVVVTGIGEGAYYVEKYSEKIRDALGLKPFHGTLNIKLLEGGPDLKRFTTGVIKEFMMEGRTFGAIKFAPVRLSLNHKKEDCYLIIPKRSHHRDEVELISELNLREKLGLRDGDKVLVELST